MTQLVMALSAVILALQSWLASHRHESGYALDLNRVQFVVDTQIATSPSDCEAHYEMGRRLNRDLLFAAAYDTLRVMVETCARDNFWPYTYVAFDQLGIANLHRSADTNRHRAFREWLKGVLYLNTINPIYYCQAVEAIAGTYNRTGPFNWVDYNAQVAIVKYILESGKCDYEREDWLQGYKETREDQRNNWELRWGDSVGNHPLDTTIPSLEDLDLQILRGQQGTVLQHSPSGPALQTVRVVENPFTHDAQIEYILNRPAQVEVTVFNTLGQTLWTEPFGRVVDEGVRRLTIPAHDLQPGPLFVRVSTLEGEVKTLQLRRTSE